MSVELCTVMHGGGGGEWGGVNVPLYSVIIIVSDVLVQLLCCQHIHRRCLFILCWMFLYFCWMFIHSLLDV